MQWIYRKHSSRTLVDQEKVRVPDIGPSRRNATKIRIEDNTITKRQRW